MHSNQAKDDDITFNDLGHLFQRVFYFIIYTFQKIFKFYWKHKFIVLLLFSVGLALYYIMKKANVKNYESTAIVVQNFESVDYLYQIVENVQNNIGSDVGQAYLSDVLGPHYKDVVQLEIEAINNLYNFSDVNTYNKVNFETLIQGSEASNNLKELNESKYFKYHKLKFLIKDTINSKKIISHFINHLNSNEHYSSYGQVFREGMQKEFAENQESLVTIDSLLHSYIHQHNLGNSQVNISSNADINKLFEIKSSILNRNLYLKTKLVDYSKIIKPISIQYHNPVVSIIPKWLIYPVLLIAIFSLIHLIKYLFKKSEIYYSSQ